MASGDNCGIVIISNPHTGKIIKTIKVGGVIHNLYMYPNGECLIGSSGGFIGLYDKNFHLKRRYQNFFNGGIRFLAPNKDKVLAASLDFTSKIFSKRGKLVMQLKGHQDWVRSCAWLPTKNDSKKSIALTASKDGFINFYDTSDASNDRNLLGQIYNIMDEGFMITTVPDTDSNAPHGFFYTNRLDLLEIFEYRSDNKEKKTILDPSDWRVKDYIATFNNKNQVLQKLGFNEKGGKLKTLIQLMKKKNQVSENFKQIEYFG
jgi:WD40 repeat protein